MKMKTKSAILSHIKKMSVSADVFWQQNQLKKLPESKNAFSGSHIKAFRQPKRDFGCLNIF